MFTTFTPKWYKNEFAPIVREAVKVGVKMETSGRFLEWIKAGRTRAERFLGVEFFIRENDWNELVDECMELGK
jgi:hypothetical protein